ncbi:hypothetical protein AZ78_3585 [Lysobacter capsici AZ78]|uniref:DUF1203 domain-containing protein n=1 Tax=Lysobacter capsici AZ78 TaxID=1444315 RepID=A0A108UBB6_9GAMM|nr:DUF1203 domain-containing protein [Lysobacter capsici]KWS06031.1 hypothetical protein AZ78_3585 [Lysobacter capsici AZ78]QWF16665.1 DUF1203 domain-containing protein [Lysobacter capsici]
MNAYRISGLSPEPFRPLFALDDDRLRAHDMRRVVADSPRGYPCRVSLTDAAVGETLLLLPYEHHALGPYRASGPIFVREAALQAPTYRNELPPILATRYLSLRAYDRDGWMRDARAVEGAAAQDELQSLFAIDGVVSVMAHNARFGCFLCRIDRH